MKDAVQLTTPDGPLYLDPAMVVALGPAPSGMRVLYLRGGHKVAIDDTPDNLQKIGIWQ
jgi:hypothetical protein